MRFKRKTEPKEGDLRTVYKFAWLPTSVGDYTVWFEHYAVKERYVGYAKLDSFDCPVREYAWFEVDRNICDYY